MEKQRADVCKGVVLNRRRRKERPIEKADHQRPTNHHSHSPASCLISPTSFFSGLSFTSFSHQCYLIYLVSNLFQTSFKLLSNFFQTSVHFFPLLSTSVLFCLLLSTSVHFCPLLSPFLIVNLAKKIIFPAASPVPSCRTKAPRAC